MISVQINTEGLAKQLSDMGSEFFDDAAAGFAKAGAIIVDQFRVEQLSGRRSDNMGLNVRKGNLRQSIKTMTEIAGAAITNTVYNRDAQYWYYHQEGLGHNPKRLVFFEYFETEGEKLYVSAVERALSMVAA